MRDSGGKGVAPGAARGLIRAALIASAVMALCAAFPAIAGAVTFSNPTPVVIPDSGPGSVYPSDIPVSGMRGSINKVTVSLNGLSHTDPCDLEFLLVGPHGQNMEPMSDAGDCGPDVSNATLTFNDA